MQRRPKAKSVTVPPESGTRGLGEFGSDPDRVEIEIVSGPLFALVARAAAPMRKSDTRAPPQEGGNCFHPPHRS